MEKRTLIALALSFAVLGFYPLVLQKFYPDYMKEKHKTELASKSEKNSLGAALPLGASTSSGLALLDIKEDVKLKSTHLNLSFNSKNAAIRQIQFLKFMGNEKREPLQIFSLVDSSAAATSIEFFSGAPISSYQSASYGEHSLEFSGSSDKIKVTKLYEFASSGYSARVKINFKNISLEPQILQYALLAGPDFPSRNAIDSQYIESNFYSTMGEKTELRHIKEAKQGKRIVSAGPVDWVAVKDRHFSVIVKPMSSKDFTGFHEGLGQHHFRAGLASAQTLLPAGGVAEHEFLLYIGPNQIEELLPLKLDPIVNFGKLDIIGKLLVGALEMLNKVCRNYGISIIVLTMLINLVLFPLTRQSYMSMKRMQLIQPQMTKLREQNKKNPEKLNREMMELYKKHKVNPFGGCLPMLLQMPVFIALYVALSKSVILINAKLFWINDLSSPDRVGLPFTLPFLGNELHVLPLIMVAAMAIQQKLMAVKTEGQDPMMASQQKMMAVMMPIIFGFIFYTMPSGLVLYWLTNTLLMTAYQLRLKNVTLT